jgi:hypothetical protein
MLATVNDKNWTELEREMTSGSASLSSQQSVNFNGFELFAAKYYCTSALLLVPALNKYNNGFNDQAFVMSC